MCSNHPAPKGEACEEGKGMVGPGGRRSGSGDLDQGAEGKDVVPCGVPELRPHPLTWYFLNQLVLFTPPARTR